MHNKKGSEIMTKPQAVVAFLVPLTETGELGGYGGPDGGKRACSVAEA